MSKYQALTSHLKSQKNSYVSMSFEELERVIGVPLPRSASAHRAWWSNNPTNNVMTHAWLAAGFRTEQVDMEGRRLVFRRDPRTPEPPASKAPSGPVQGGRTVLFGVLKGELRLADGVDLTAPTGLAGMS
ncbi:hypothetical protein GCM10008171_00810 [Methylopila jiangsuensis]|uniref:DUF7662 domain-containing protein n=1 Tax=Methylopila jiangsuensis TaxID=586230 RepID=A0A9W6N1F5_9HYPH|nr:hypothetical protein [Methylopila jiangsuensis]MDR6287211.1 hypothetical protein [Methylopila jiangsuensis]GLK74829.1 hypothetical protein GCM10008171_00810 [Methylopila jiangsuensis]